MDQSSTVPPESKCRGDMYFHQMVQINTLFHLDVGMQLAFQHFDHDGNGAITAVELQSILRALNMVESLDECQNLIEKFDLDGEIYFHVQMISIG